MKSRKTLVCAWVVIMGCANNPPPDHQSDANEPADAGGEQTVDLTEAPLFEGGAVSEERANDPATWSRIYNELLNNMSYASNCTGEGCHNPGIQKDLDLSTQANGYVSVQAKLAPGNPAGSTIVYELETGMMPRGRPRMPAADLERIKAWILRGAADD